MYSEDSSVEEDSDTAERGAMSVSEDDPHSFEEPDDLLGSHHHHPPQGRNMRQRLTRFFHFYEPSQVPLIPQWLENWKGREDALLKELIRFHGPEPTYGSDPRSAGFVRSSQSKLRDRCVELMQQFCLLYCPERFHEADALVDKWAGSEIKLKKKLEQQAQVRDYTYKHFADKCPHRVGEVPSILREWLGREAELIGFLQTSLKRPDAKQQPPPLHKDSDGESEMPPTPFASWRDMLLHFYRVYNPEKMAEVEVILRFYSGREEELFRKLHQRYIGSVPDTQTPVVASSASKQSGVLSSLHPMDSNSKKKVRLLCAAWNPDCAAEVADLLENFEGSEVELMQKLVNVVPPSAEGDAASHGGINKAAMALLFPSQSKATQTEANPHGAPTTISELEAKSAELWLALDKTRFTESMLASKLSLPPQSLDPLPPPQNFLSTGNHTSESTNTLSLWLEGLRLQRLYSLFVQNDVDFETMVHLTRSDLERMGITGSDQHAILDAVARIV